LYDYQNGINPAYGIAPPGLLSWWHFDTDDWGGGQGQVPLTDINLQLAFGIISNSVAITNSSSSLRYNVVESTGHTNLSLQYGSVSFWFNPNWTSADAAGSGPQCEGRLIEIGGQGSAHGWWGLVIGSAGTNLYFGTQTNSSLTLTTNLDTPISWHSNEWHQLVLAYSTNETSLYIDGEPIVTNGAGIVVYPDATARSQGFAIGSSSTGTNRVNGFFDELQTFNYLLSASEIESNYQASLSFDSEGGDLPDWWQIQYFGTNHVNPYQQDSSGDGWNYVQDYQYGFIPGTWHTPPPPQNVAWHFDATGTNVVLTWDSGGGAIDHYEIDSGYDGDSFAEIGDVDSNTLTFTTAAGSITNSIFPVKDLRVTAVFTNGDTSTSSYVAAGQLISLDRDCQVVRGPEGKFYLTIPNAPSNLSWVHVFWGSGAASPFDIDSSNIVNGVVAIPSDAQAPFLDPPSTLAIQLVDTHGRYSEPVRPLFNSPETSYDLPAPSTNFVNAAAQMKENLKFLLRAAGVLWPFGYSSGLLNEGSYYKQNLVPGSDESDIPESYLARGTASTNYEYYGFHTYSPNLDYSFINELRPVQEHFIWRNFVYNLTDYTNGSFDTGITEGLGVDSFDLSSDMEIVYWPQVYLAKYQYAGSGNEAPLPLAFDSSSANWIFHQTYNNDDSGLYAYLAGIPVKNIYGLDLGSIYANTNLVEPGGTFPGGWVFEKYAMPDLQVVNYFFTSQTPFLNYTWYSGYNGPAPAIPGSPAFSPTNTSPLLITGIGQPFTVSGWAKMAIANGNPNKYAYLEQYFDQAYQVDTNGNATTNSAGLLSPYGDFFPTIPGPAELVTMPDIDTGERGTGMVNVVKLQLDVNHDGNMDLSFGGPDNTSPTTPMEFWANNNYDRFTLDKDDQAFYDDDVLNTSQAATCPYTPDTPTPDCNYLDGAGHRVIPCARDLEDFTRLWVCGITTNLLAQLPSGSTVTLSWGDVGSPNTGNPTIDIFTAADPDGGIGYLTNSGTADSQVDSLYCPYIGRLGPGQSIQLNASQFANHWAGNHFIWCGVSNGTGGLTLTIADGSGNTLAQTTAYIQIMDIKQMYERWTIGDVANATPLTNALPATEDLPPYTPAFRYTQPQDTNTPYILYVHGWNMDRYDKDRFAETAFKRLYWQGYKGRFGVFRWPTDYDFNATLMDALFQPHNYDGSEYTAWQSAAGLLNKLKDLNSQYPGHVYVLAHSMGNVVTGEALRQAAQQGLGQLVNTYVASQGAIPAHVYDATVTSPYLIDYTHKNPSYPFSAPGAPKTPNIYGNRLTNTIAAAGHRINFFNVNDYALSPDAWCFDQELKPDTFIGSGYYFYAGSTNDPAPWNNFEYALYAGSPLTLDIVNNLNDRYEVLAYAADPYSRALGSTPIGTFTRGVDLSQIWPSDTVHPTHPFDEHFYHSAEFRGDYWQQQGYWSELLSSDAFNLK